MARRVHVETTMRAQHTTTPGTAADATGAVDDGPISGVQGAAVARTPEDWCAERCHPRAGLADTMCHCGSVRYDDD